MIGGTDLVFSAPTRQDDASFIVGVFRGAWPELVIQSAEWDQGRDGGSLGPAELTALREFFIYRDHEAFTSWTAAGANADNVDSMVHILVDDDALTFVVAEGDSRTRQLADEAIRRLREGRQRAESPPGAGGLRRTAVGHGAIGGAPEGAPAKPTLKTAFPSRARRDLTHVEGTLVTLLEPLNARRTVWLVEVSVRDEGDANGFWTDRIEVPLRDLAFDKEIEEDMSTADAVNGEEHSLGEDSTWSEVVRGAPPKKAA